MQSTKVFAARSSATAILSSFMILVLLGYVVDLCLHHRPRGIVDLVVLAVLVVFFGVVAFFAAIAPSMKYTVAASEVISSCGPFHWKIPISQIRSMIEKDVEWLPWSEGWKLPGYALFKIEYGQCGSVR
ncbi:MAG: PH domain-containing protein, partial [Terracidiphilus sp.]